MSNKGKRVQNGPKAKKPFFLSRLSRFWRFALLSCMATTALILILLVVWDNMYGMVEGGVGTYTPPVWVYDDDGEGGESGVLITQNPAATKRPAPQGLSVRDDIYTFLLAGRNEGLTDTLMVVTLDLVAESINVLSIPRDTVVQNAARSVKKINGAYNSGGGKEDGMSLLLNEIDSIVGFMPKNYFTVDMKGFVRLVDAIGPIGFDVPVRMSKPSEGINLNKGFQELNGNQALQLVRYRGYSGGAGGMEHDDYGRMQMQQMFLKAVAKQMLQAENIVKIPELMDIGFTYTLSNMTVPEMVAVAEKVFTIPADNIHFVTLPTVSVKSPKEVKGMYYEVIQSEEALALINSTINPFNMDITADMVEHMKLTEG